MEKINKNFDNSKFKIVIGAFFWVTNGLQKTLAMIELISSMILEIIIFLFYVAQMTQD